MKKGNTENEGVVQEQMVCHRRKMSSFLPRNMVMSITSIKKKEVRQFGRLLFIYYYLLTRSHPRRCDPSIRRRALCQSSYLAAITELIFDCNFPEPG